MEWDDLDTLGSEEERLLRSVTEEEDIYFDDDEPSEVIPMMSGVAIVPGVNQVIVFPSDSFVVKGLLARVLEEVDLLPGCYFGASVELFGFSFRTSTALVNPHTLFMIFRKQLHNLTATASEGLTDDTTQRTLGQCSEFLHFVDCYVHRHIVAVSKQTNGDPSTMKAVTDLLSQLAGLLTELDSLSMISNSLEAENTSVNKLSNQIGLLQLHVHWTAVSSSYRLIVGLGSVPSDTLTELAERILSLLQLLLDLTVVRFNQVPPTMVSGQFNQLLCSHTSVMELWLLVLQSLHHLANKGYTQSLWSLLVGELQQYLHPTSNNVTTTLGPSENSHPVSTVVRQMSAIPNHPVSFCWWALTRIMTMIQYDMSGVYHPPGNEGQSVTMDTVLATFIQELVSLSLQIVGNTIESPLLKLFLNCYHCIILLTVASHEPVVLLWEHFYKQFTDPSYTVPRRPLQNPQSILTGSIRQLYTHIVTLCSISGDKVCTYKDEDSFRIFLRILSVTIKCTDTAWRQLKGKIFSKFHKKKMAELTPDGLVKVVYLFLVLAQIADVSEVGKKMINLLNMRNLASANEKSLTVLWKAIFTMLLTYVEKSCSFKDVSDILLPLIGQIVDNLVTRSSDGSGPQLWDGVCVILDGIQELFDNSQSFKAGVNNLIGPFIGDLLAHCKGNEIGRVVLFISDIITTINGHYVAINGTTTSNLESQDVSVEKLQDVEALSELTNTLWQCVLPGLRERVKDPTCSNRLAELLGTLSSFSLECVELCQSPDNHSSHCDLLMEEFVFDESLPAGLVSLYLSNALSSDVINDHVTSCDQTQLQVIHSWLRCLIQMYTPPTCVDHVKSLTRFITSLNLVASIQPIASDTDPISTLKMLLGAIHTKHITAATMAEATHWRDYCREIVGDLSKHNVQLISGTLSAECMKMAYQVSSIVVRCCPKIIYSKVESRCLLPRLLDQLILPLATEKKPPPRGIPLMIRSHLHHFLMGLMQLEPKRDDFIRRKIKQIFIKYFISFTQKSQPNSLVPNPGPNSFTLFLQPCFKPVVSAEARDTLIFTMELIATHFMTPSQDSSNYLLAVFQYIGEVTERITNDELTASCCPVLLGDILTCLLSCETGMSHHLTKPDKLKSQVVAVLRKLLQASNKHPSITPHSTLLPIMREYLVKNLKQHQVTTLAPLSKVASVHPSLVQVFLPTVDKMIEECSSGQTSLRSAYRTLSDICTNGLH